jgi:hypothetical protein
MSEAAWVGDALIELKTVANSSKIAQSCHLGQLSAEITLMPYRLSLCEKKCGIATVNVRLVPYIVATPIEAVAAYDSESKSILYLSPSDPDQCRTV